MPKIGYKMSEASKEKMRDAKLKKPTKYWLGKKITVSQETREKMSLSQKRIGNKPPIKRGSESHLWKGGVTPLNQKIRQSLEYKLWRKAVFERDNHICIWGGKEHGNKLNADHIKPFALFPELRFAIDNGRTLCEDCHRKTDTWGKKYGQRD